MDTLARRLLTNPFVVLPAAIAFLVAIFIVEMTIIDANSSSNFAFTYQDTDGTHRVETYGREWCPNTRQCDVWEGLKFVRLTNALSEASTRPIPRIIKYDYCFRWFDKKGCSHFDLLAHTLKEE